MKFKKLMLTVAAASVIGVAAPKTTASNAVATTDATEEPGKNSSNMSTGVLTAGLGAVAGVAGAGALWKMAQDKLEPTRSGGAVTRKAAQQAVLLKRAAMVLGGGAALSGIYAGVQYGANSKAADLTKKFVEAVDAATEFAVVGKDDEAKKANSNQAVNLIEKEFDVKLAEGAFDKLLANPEAVKALVKACPQLAPLLMKAKKDEDAVVISAMAGLAQVAANPEAVVTADELKNLEKDLADATKADKDAAQAKTDLRAKKVKAKKAKKVAAAQKAFDEALGGTEKAKEDYEKAVEASKAADKALEAAAKKADDDYNAALEQAEEEATKAFKPTEVDSEASEEDKKAAEEEDKVRLAEAVKAAKEAVAKEKVDTTAADEAKKALATLRTDEVAKAEKALKAATDAEASPVASKVLDNKVVKKAKDAAEKLEAAKKAMESAAVKARDLLKKNAKAEEEAEDSRKEDTKKDK